MATLIKKFVPTKRSIGSIVMWQVPSTPHSYMSFGVLVKILDVKENLVPNSGTQVEITPVAGDGSCIWLINPLLESTEVEKD